MPRFSHEVVAQATPAIAWVDMQSAEAWGFFFGADEVDNVRSNGDGHLEGCDWAIDVAGRRIHGGFRVTESQEPARMAGNIDAGDWRGRVEVNVTPLDELSISMAARLELEAVGFSAFLVLPIVSRVIGNELPGRLEGFAKRLETRR